MKKYALIVSMLLLFTTCGREKELSEIEIDNVSLERGYDYVKITVDYSYPEILKAVRLHLSETMEMSAAQIYDCKLDGMQFNVEINGLNEGVKYYYCFEYDNGTNTEKGEVEYFLTMSLPVVETNDVTNIHPTTAIFNATLKSFDSNNITSKGFCWSVSPNPTLEDVTCDIGGGTSFGISKFTYNVTDLAENTTYYVKAYIINDECVIYGEEVTFTTTFFMGTVNGHEWIDLGLKSGTKWAVCNIGAESPESYGEYFPTNEFKFYDEIYEIRNDKAVERWGEPWRMPTREEQEELMNCCTWTWTKQGEKNGYKVTGPNGQYIFLPATGFKSGQSIFESGVSASYLNSSCNDLCYIYFMYFENNIININFENRSYGRTIRAVLK